LRAVGSLYPRNPDRINPVFVSSSHISLSVLRAAPAPHSTTSLLAQTPHNTTV